jgi:hypothetical protein
MTETELEILRLKVKIEATQVLIRLFYTGWQTLRQPPRQYFGSNSRRCGKTTMELLCQGFLLNIRT